MNDEQISDVWALFKNYVEKKQVQILAEKFIDLLADYGVADDVLIAALGYDADLDYAIKYYLDYDNPDNDYDYE